MAIKVYSPTDFEDTSSGVSIDGNLVVDTSVLYVDTANNRVGIGTTSPAAKLEIYNTGIDSFRIGDGTNRMQWYGNGTNDINTYGASFRVYSHTSDIVFRTATADPAVTIKQGGNVGIGTASPSYKLHVDDDVSYGGIFIEGNNAPGLSIRDNSGTSISKIYVQSTASSQGNLRISSDDNNTATTPTIEFRIGNSEKMRIADNGNVGIGTTGPQKKLDVSGSGIVASLGGAFNVGSFAGFHFGYSETTYGNDLYKKSALVFERTDNHSQGGNASGKIHFLLNNISNGSATSLAHSVVTIDTDAVATQGSARVGIGTTSPQGTLEVEAASTINGTELAISNDYGESEKFITFRNGSDIIGQISTYGRHSTSGAGPAMTFDLSNGTSAVERLRITKDGNVGIGTSGPTSYGSSARTLEVRGNTGTGSGLIRVSNADNSIGTSLYSSSSAGTLNVQTNHPLTFATNNSERVRIDSSGNVGIGTASPSATLHLSAASPYIYLDDTSTSGTRPRFQMLNGDVGTTQTVILGFNNTSGTNLQEVIAFNENGNVGIGTTSPIAKQHNVITSSGTALLLNSTNGGSGAYVNLDFNTYATSQANYANAAASIRVIDDGLYSGHITFRTKGSTVGASQTEKMRIDTSGNVGIGTTSPGAKFDVRGTAKFRGSLNGVTIVPTATGGNIYVYELDAPKVYIESAGDTIFNTGYNFGIGTASPEEKLHVIGAIETSREAGATENTLIYNQQSAKWGSSTYPGIIESAGNNSFLIGSSQDIPLHLARSGAIALTIGTGGNVGIGTTSPSSKLEVSSSGAHGILISKDTGTTSNSGRLFFETDTVSEGFSFLNSNGLMTIRSQAQAGATSGNIRVAINGSGSVGIGTTNPAGALHIESSSTKVFLSNTDYNNGTSTGSGTIITTGATSGNTYSMIYGFQSGNTSYANLVVPGGNVLIGTTTDSGDKLNIAGNLNLSGDLKINGGTFLTDDGVSHYVMAQSNLYLYSGSSATMTLEAGGDVGIGTTNPSYKLHVDGTIYAPIFTSGGVTINNGDFLFDAQGGGDGFQMDYYNGQMYIGNNAGSTWHMVIKDNGNVGVGTTSPASKLHVWNGGVQVSGFQSIGNPLTFLQSDYSDSAVRIKFLNINPSNGYDADLGIQLSNTSNVVTDVMRIKGSSGNVGIGTTSPGYKLDVRSVTTDPVAFFGFSQTSSSSNGLIKLNSGRIPQNGSDFTGESGIIFGHSGGTGGVNFDGQGGYIKSIRLNTYAASNQSDSALVFATSNDNTDTERMRITNDGNVGIGTTSPTAKLSVNGAILAGGKYSYRKAYASLDTTGAAVAGLNGSFNGASAMFKFEMHGGVGHYQKVVYSCHNAGGNWVATKVIDEGTNELDVEASASNNTTITFTFKARNSTQQYSPAVEIEASGTAINTTYL